MNFKIIDYPVIRHLSPQDLSFFYYDVAKISELEQLVEKSNDELLETAKNAGIILKPIQQQTFSCNKYNPTENEIVFTFLTNKGKKELSHQTALFKHLRNSFAHYRISYTKDNRVVKIEDCLYGGYTMKGIIEIDKLKNLIFNLKEYSEEQISLHTK